MILEPALDVNPIARRREQRQPTVADAGLLLLLAAAAILRFVQLGNLPLSPTESREALSVWQFWQTSGQSITSVSPAFFSLTATITEVFGYNDTVMRLIPALFGMGAVMIPWLWRSRLGNVGALVMSAMIAFSPIHTVLSRTAGGDAIAIVAIMLLVTSWARFQERGELRWLFRLAVAAGLGLASSPLFFTGLATLTAAWVVQRIAGPSFPSDVTLKAIGSQPRKHAVAVGAASLLLFGAMGLIRPAGLSAVAALPAQWLQQFGIGSLSGGVLDPILATVRYEIWLLIPGLAAVIWAAVQDRPIDVFCVYWLAAAVVFTLLQPAQMNNAAIITLPGFFLVGRAAKAVSLPRIDSIGWGLGGLIFVLVGIAAVNVARYSRAIVYNPQQLSFMGIAMIALIIAAASMYFVGLWKARNSVQGLLIGLFTILCVYQWGTAYWMGHYAANDPRERWIVSSSDGDVRLMVDVLSDMSLQSEGDAHEIDLFSIVDTPLIRWYLREFSNASYGNSVPAGSQHAAVISPEAYSLSLSSAYSGTDFELQRSRLPFPAGQSLLMDTLRWWLLHDSKAPVDTSRVIVWWRSDLMELP